MVKESIPLVEGVTPLDRMYILICPVSNHEFTHGRKRCGEESLLPVTIEAEQCAHIVDARHIILRRIAHRDTHFTWFEVHAGRFSHQYAVCSLFLVAHV